MRTRHGGRLFLVSCASAEGLWVLALAGVSLHLTVSRPFPLLAGLIAFAAAAAFFRLSSGRGWRRATILALHLLGLMGCLAWVIPGGLQRPGWFPKEGAWREWAWAGQTAFWITVLWLKGVGFVRNPATRERIGSQFDKGVAAFGFVLLFGLFLEIKWGYAAVWGGTLPLFGLFFVMSVVSMGLQTSAGSGGTSADPMHAKGWSLAFAIVVLGVGTGVILLLMPVLNQTARLGYEALKTTTSPLGPILVSILRFIFAPRHVPLVREELPSGSNDAQIPTSGEGLEIGPLEWAIGWGLSGLLVAVVAGVSLIAAFYVLRALLARTRDAPSGPGRRSAVAEWVRGLLAFLGAFSPGAVLRALRDPGPVRLYGRLAVWGGRSGLPLHPSETPLEYGRRLSARFDGLANDIAMIVDLVNREVYGDISPGPEHRTKGRLAWRRLRSPRHWPSRVKALVLPAESPFPTRQAGALETGEPGAGH